MDPFAIDRWLRDPAPMNDNDDEPDPALEARRVTLRARLTFALARLPASEAQALQLHAEGLRQVQIAAVLGTSQPAVCLKLRRAVYRVRVIVQLPMLEHDDVARVLASLGPCDLSAITVAVLTDYWLTSSQNRTARRLGFTQGRVRRAVIGGVEQLRTVVQRRPDLEPLVSGFGVLAQHPGVLGATRRAAPTSGAHARM